MALFLVLHGFVHGFVAPLSSKGQVTKHTRSCFVNDSELVLAMNKTWCP